MATDYLPPDGTRLPFNFTKDGYEPPSGQLLFNFVSQGTTGTLQAAINVVSPYWETTHTYPKTCPKYVVGYGGGRVQIIKGRCLYGGIRDLRCLLTGLSIDEVTSNLPVYINSVLRNDQKDLPAYYYAVPPIDLSAYIDVHQPDHLFASVRGWTTLYHDLPAFLQGIKKRSEDQILAIIDVHQPENLLGSVRGWVSSYHDLTALLQGINKRGGGQIPATIGVHSPTDLPAGIGGHLWGTLGATIYRHYPKNLSAHLIGSVVEVVLDLPVYVWGWETTFLSATARSWHREQQGVVAGRIHGFMERFLGANIPGTHFPVDLGGYFRAGHQEARLIGALIYGWAVSDLNASTNIVYPFDLGAYTNAILPEDLSAYLKVRYRQNLTASTYGWQFFGLGASINQIYADLLPASIYGRDDMYGDLRARLKGTVSSDHQDLALFIRSVLLADLTAQIRATYLSGITAYLYAIPPRDLVGRLRGWQEGNLQATMVGQDYPWNLTAEIYPTGQWVLLGASVYPKRAVEIYTTLNASAYSWEARYLGSSISGEDAHHLWATINALGYSSNLHARIVPKMIRLTTVVNVHTMNHLDLSAIINYSCFKTGFSDLSSNIYSKPKADLQAYIKVIRFNYKPVYLPAKVGYHNTVSEVDKFKLRINIHPSDVTFEDKLMLRFMVLAAGNFLGAYIRGTLRYDQLSARIVAEGVPKYKYPTPLQNREVVVHKNYAGVFEKFEYVELSFKSVVKDYYYSSDADYAWKKDRFERWILDVKSYLPTNTALQLKRRLHRATTLYDLRKFESVDEAMRYAISFVTEYPQGNLSASIWHLSSYAALGGIINPKYVRSSRKALSASISASGHTIVLGSSSGITKI